MLRALLLIQIVFNVNELHFQIGTGIPAVNLANIFFFAIFMLQRPLEDDAVQQLGQLRAAIRRFLLLLGFAALLAIVNGSDPMDAFTAYKNAALYPLMYFQYLYCKQDREFTRVMIIAVMVVAAVAGVEAIREGLDYGIASYSDTHRAAGPFGPNYRDSNRAGVFYAMFLPMFVALALFLEKQRFWQLAALGGVPVMVAAVLFTYSRQSYFIALLGFSLLLLRKNVVLAIVVAIVLSSLANYLPGSFAERVAQTHQESSGGGGAEFDESTSSRWEIWAGAGEMISEQPYGVGLGRFPYNIGKYCRFKGMDAHNAYVLMTAETGLQGLVVLIMLVGALIRFGKFLRVRMMDRDAESRALALGFTITTISMLIGNFYGSPLLVGAVMGDFWVLCGLLERYAILGEAKEEANPEEAGSNVEEVPWYRATPSPVAVGSRARLHS